VHESCLLLFTCKLFTIILHLEASAVYSTALRPKEREAFTELINAQ